jgi:hypothetical protein
VSIPFLLDSFSLDQNPNVASVGLDSAGGRTRAKGSLWRRLGRTQNERRRRLALASGFRLSHELSQDIANTVRALDRSRA